MDFDSLRQYNLLEWTARGVDERTCSLADNFAAGASRRNDFVRLALLAQNFEWLAALFPVDQTCLMKSARSLLLFLKLTSGEPSVCISSKLIDVIEHN